MSLDANRLANAIKQAMGNVDNANNNDPNRSTGAAKDEFALGVANAIINEFRSATFLIPAGTPLMTPAGPATFPAPVPVNII